MRTFEKYKESRLAKMRAGQTYGEIVVLPSEETIRFTVVPLTDGEYLKALALADEITASETMSGMAVKDQRLKQAILFFAAREIHDWQQPFFESPEEVAEMDMNDTNRAYDIYLEMIAVASPSLQMLTDEEIDALKGIWERIEWSALSGQQLYAARRFLNSLPLLSLAVSSSGSRSIQSLTEMNAMQDAAVNAALETTDQS